MLIAIYLTASVLTTVLHSMALGHVHEQWRWTGVAMIAVGLIIRAWGMRTLGSAFARTLRTVGDQEAVRSGPYRLFRHPGYAGSLLVWIGYGLGTGNRMLALRTGVLLIAAYSWRIHAEEALLIGAFGADYADYATTPKRLVPFVY